MSQQPTLPPFTQLPPLRHVLQPEARPGGPLYRTQDGPWVMNPNNHASPGPDSMTRQRDFSFQHQSVNLPPGHVRFHQPDPARLPLPLNSDADLVDPPTIARATGHSPVHKVGGSRRKNQPAPEPISLKTKGKRKRAESASGSQSESNAEQAADRPSGHGGRRLGAGNYKALDLDQLLTLTEQELPLGQKGWQKIASKFKRWALATKRPVRDARSLEAKYKQLAKTTKPTGDGKRPESVTRAKEIERLINERAGTRCVDDSELDCGGNDEDDDDDLPAAVAKVRTAVVRSVDKSEIQPRRNRAAQSTELMQKLASALDPEVQKTRDDDCASRSLQNTQIFTLSQQLRDSQATNDKLRGELDKVRDRVHKLERSLDRARMKLELIHGPRPKRLPTGRKHQPGFVRRRGKIQSVETFPEGGSYTTWITDGSTATDWSDSDKENFDFEAYQKLVLAPHPPMYGLQESQSSSSSPLRTGNFSQLECAGPSSPLKHSMSTQSHS